MAEQGIRSAEHGRYARQETVEWRPWQRGELERQGGEGCGRFSRQARVKIRQAGTLGMTEAMAQGRRQD